MDHNYSNQMPQFLEKTNPRTVLKLTVFLIFIGRAYQHIFWDGPYRSVLWDEDFFSGFVQNVFGLTWREFVESETMDYRIQLFIKTIGVIFALAGFSALFYNAKRKFLRPIILVAIFFLSILAIVSFKSKFFQFSEGFEFGIQLFSPILLLWSYRAEVNLKRLITMAKVAIAITFVGHGIYAVGIFPQPGYFIDMTIKILHLSEDGTRLFLKTAGILDFIVATLLFIPKLQKPALFYCIFWGLLTAMARIVAGFSIDFPFQTTHQWAFETVYRLSHGLLPLWTLLQISQSKLRS